MVMGSCTEATSDVFTGTYGSKLKALFTDLSAATQVLHWDDMLMCVGDVVSVDIDVLKLEGLEFRPHTGFHEVPTETFIQIFAPNFLEERFSLHTGCRVICAGKGVFNETSNQIKMQQDAYVIHFPEFEKDMAWDFTHLFAGAFAGWEQAAGFLQTSRCGFALGRQIAIDHDENVMQTWAYRKNRSFHRAPLKMKVWEVAADIGILADVSDLSFMRAVSAQVNSAFTMSPPCVSWSRGGKGQGLFCQNGWAFLEGLRSAIFCQACWILAECADELKKHPHFSHIQKLAELAGYTLVWDQVMPFHHMSDSFRTRWLAVWIRKDVESSRFGPVFRLQVHSKVSWTSSCYEFDLPHSMQEQLRLFQSEFEAYSDKELLPPAKRARFQF